MAHAGASRTCTPCAKCYSFCQDINLAIWGHCRASSRSGRMDGGGTLPTCMPERRAAFWVMCPWPGGLAGMRSVCKQPHRVRGWLSRQPEICSTVVQQQDVALDQARALPALLVEQARARLRPALHCLFQVAAAVRSKQQTGPWVALPAAADASVRLCSCTNGFQDHAGNLLPQRWHRHGAAHVNTTHICALALLTIYLA